MFKLYTVILILLFSSFGFGNDLSGSQCKSNLEPISQLRTNAFLFNDMLSHYRNPLGMRLQNFRLGQEGVEPGSRVHTYIRNVREAIISCPQKCEGIVSNRGSESQSVFNCSNFSQLSVLAAINAANAIADNDTNEALEEEEPEEEEAPTADPAPHFADVDADQLDLDDDQDQADNDRDDDNDADDDEEVVSRPEEPINGPAPRREYRYANDKAMYYDMAQEIIEERRQNEPNRSAY